MHHTVNVNTRPERTSDQIAADRKAATAFFARYDNPKTPQSRNVFRLVAYYAHDWKLICCDIEARQWAKQQPDNDHAHRAQRRAAIRAQQAAERARLTLDTTQLRPYVDADTNAAMPAIRTARPAGFQDPSRRRNAATFWAKCDDPTSAIRRHLDTQRQPFQQWLTLNPHYGPTHKAESPKLESKQYRFDRYKKGSIRPAGMTYERALRIAIAAQNATD